MNRTQHSQLRSITNNSAPKVPSQATGPTQNRDPFGPLRPEEVANPSYQDFLLGEGLHNAEEKLRLCAMRGETCVIGDGTRPLNETAQNRIRGSFLRYLVRGGCSNTTIHGRGIRVRGAFVVCDMVEGQQETSERALDFHSLNLENDLMLNDSVVDGSIILYGANARTLSFNGTSVNAFRADRLTLEGSLSLRDGFHAREMVRLRGVCIGSNLSLMGGQLDATPVSLGLDRADIHGSLFLGNGFRAKGDIRLLGTKVGSSVSCRGGLFGGAARMDNANIAGNLFLDEGFVCRGSLHFPNARIGGNLTTKDAVFSNDDLSISGNRATIEGNIILGTSFCAGPLAFSGASIGGDFSAQGASLEGAPCLQLRNANISGTLTFRDIAYAKGELDLSGASCRTVNMDGDSWRQPSAIKLDNFIYKGFNNLPKGCTSDFWKEWLMRQPKKHLTTKLRPKPWEQLANVLESMGYEDEAQAVRIHKQTLLTDFMQYHDPHRYVDKEDGNRRMKVLTRLTIFWRRYVTGPVVSYGYQPGKAVLYLAVLICFGMVVFWQAALNGIMTPTHPLIYKEANGGFIPAGCAENWVYFPDEIASQCAASVPSEYSEFQALIYAADISLPVVNLRMESDWSPRVVHTDGSRHWAGWMVRTYEWISITFGWALSLLFASAIGGIIRR